MKSRANFVDYVRISARAGDGGHGCISFLRMKGNAFGGPDGGDGGQGGSIYLEGKREIMTLADVKARPHIIAKRGANGGGKNCFGKKGKDITIYVPLGTHIFDEDTEEIIGDITEDEQRLLIARGGDGGKGNQHYATPTNKAPRKAQDGFPGEERNLILELKVIADVGFVGLPNAGKSTLLKALTNADPDIAPYPFTTLSPNLGVILSNDYSKHITLADIPGLIEGAHTGAGLGHRFLRHIERTRVIIHLVAPEAGEDSEGNPTLSDSSPDTMWYSYELIRQELVEYSEDLLNKPYLVAINKIDLMTEDQVKDVQKFFEDKLGYKPPMISAMENDGLEILKENLESLLQKVSDEEHS